MKKILLALSFVFGLVSMMHAAVEGSDLDVTGYNNEIYMTAKSSIGLYAGETITVPLKKLATVNRYVPYERDLYFRVENNGFTVTFMIPAGWNGKSNVDASISLDTNIEFNLRKFQSRSKDWVFYVDSSYSNSSRYMRLDGIYFDLYEKNDRAVLSFAKSEIIVKEPAANTVMDGIGKFKIKGKLERDVQVQIAACYYCEMGIQQNIKIWIEPADSVVMLPAGAKTAEFKFKYMGDPVVNIQNYADVEFYLNAADSDVIGYESNAGKITIKDAQKADITGSFANQTGTEVTYSKSQSFDLVIDGNLPEPGGSLRIYDQFFYLTLGGTAVYNEDYELSFDATPGRYVIPLGYSKTIPFLFWGTKTCKVTVKYLYSATAKEDKTIQIKLTKVMMHESPSVKCKIAKGSVVNFIRKAPLPTVVAPCRYDAPHKQLTLHIPNLAKAHTSNVEAHYTDSWVTIIYNRAFYGLPFGFSFKDGNGYSAWLDSTHTDSSFALLRLYGGHPVCQGVEFEVSIDSVGAYFEKAPVIKANVYDPVKDPAEMGKPKKIAAKAVTKLSKTAPVSTFVVSLSTTPALYDKKALKTAYKEGKYFADVAKDIQKIGAGMDMTLTWKQGKTGSENQSLYDKKTKDPQYKDAWVGTVIAVPPEFAATEPLTVGGAATDSVVIADTEVVVTGKFFTAKPKAALEYKVDGKIKTLKLKTSDAKMDGNGNSTVTVIMPKQTKIDALGDGSVYLIIDTGSALAARKVMKPTP